MFLMLLLQMYKEVYWQAVAIKKKKDDCGQ